jgi:hypothetical protein
MQEKDTKEKEKDEIVVKSKKRLMEIVDKR